MSNDVWKNMSDEDLKKQYSKCCDELDVVEDHIRDITLEMDRRRVEKEGRAIVPKAALEELIKEWTEAWDVRASNREFDPTRQVAMTIYQRCLTDLKNLLHK